MPHDPDSCNRLRHTQFLVSLGEEDGMELLVSCAERAKGPRVSSRDPTLSALLFVSYFERRRSFHFNYVAHPATIKEISKNGKQGEFPPGPARKRRGQ